MDRPPFVPPPTRIPASARARLLLCGLACACFALTGCGALHGWGQVGPDLKPKLGTSVSIPLGR